MKSHTTPKNAFSTAHLLRHSLTAESGPNRGTLSAALAKADAACASVYKASLASDQVAAGVLSECTNEIINSIRALDPLVLEKNPVRDAYNALIAVAESFRSSVESVAEHAAELEATISTAEETTQALLSADSPRNRIQARR